MKPPAFQFYADDFQSGTIDMTDAEVGLYVRLLCVQWSRGSIPGDIDEVMRFSRGSTTLQAERVMQKFKAGDDGCLRNQRLESEREKQAQWREKSRMGGKKSAVVRSCLNHPSTTLQPPMEPTTQPNANSPLSTLHSPSNTPAEPPSAGLVPEGFAEFWELYPKKADKHRAMTSWKKIPLKLHAAILENITGRIRSDESWSKDGGKYVPNAATYLNGKRWEDQFQTRIEVTAPKVWTPEEMLRAAL